MTTITTRSGKGSPLTNDEVDANFTNLNDDKIEASGDSMTGNLSFGDNDKAIFGAGSDLQIYHASSQSYIEDAGSGNLNFKSNGNNFNFLDGSDNVVMQIDIDSETTLYHNTSAKLATTSTGIDVTGTVTADGLTVEGDTLSMSHTGNTSTISLTQKAGTQNSVATISANREDASTSASRLLFSTNNGTSTLQRLRIDNGGNISFYEDTGTTAKLTWDASAESLNFADNSKAIFGAGSDLQIYHNASNSYIDDAGTGGLVIRSSQVNIGKYTGETAAVFTADGSVQLRYDNSAKFETTATGIDVTGTVTADGLTVDGDGTVSANTTSNAGSIYNANTSGTVLKLRSGSVGGTAAVLGVFDGNNNEQARFTASGRLGIGTSSPGNLLEVAGATPIVEINSTSGSPELQFSDGGVDEFSIQYDTGANALKFVEGGVGTHVTIKDGGNVGIGTSSPDTSLHISEPSTATARIRLEQTDSTLATDQAVGVIEFEQNDAAGAGVPAKLGAFAEDPNAAVGLRFYTGTGATANERMRLDSSGNLLVGTTSTYSVSKMTLEYSSNANFGIALRDSGTATDARHFTFIKGGSVVGTIQSTSSATSYNTSSDQRLKDNIVDAPSASDDIDAIQVRSFDWKVDGSHQKYGMVAQELLTVAPDAVTEGETEEDMMGVDYSKLVPMLVKEIQSLRARVAQLEGAN